jgi:hypothetical protein
MLIACQVLFRSNTARLIYSHDISVWRSRCDVIGMVLLSVYLFHPGGSHRSSSFCAFHGKMGAEGYSDWRRQCLFDFIAKRQRHQRYGRSFRRVMSLRGSWLNATEPLSRRSENGANATVSRIGATPPPTVFRPPSHQHKRPWRLYCVKRYWYHWTIYWR